MPKCLLIIDSHAVIHRAFHALPLLKNKKGELTQAIYGFLLVFFKAIKEFRPDFIAATFDLPGPTLRHKQFKDYKATRPKTPEELSQQIPKIKELLAAFDVPIFEKQGYEADDLIGAIARQTERKQVFPKVDTIILTGDLDALQLVNPQTKVYALRKGVKDTVLYDAKKVQERYDGLTPSQLLDYRALRGDPSDNIPGVTGIGEKTAIHLLKEFRTLENLYKEIDTDSAKAAKIKKGVMEKLKQYKEQAFLSKELARIKKEAPIDFKLEQCGFGEYNEEQVINVLEGLGFRSLIKRLPGLALAASRASNDSHGKPIKDKPSHLRIGGGGKDNTSQLNLKL